MLGSRNVNDAPVALLSAENEDSDPDLIGFVTGRADEGNEPDQAAGQVDDWADHFETGTYKDIADEIDLSDLGRDFTGWTSMYDGNLIDNAEMQEWLDETI